VSAFAATSVDESAVRDIIERRNTAYHNLDAKTLASLLTPDFRFVDRFGDNILSKGPEFNERMFAWTFKEVYKGKNPPQHSIVSLRFVAPEVAVVQTQCEWPEIKLDNGYKVPPHGEVDTFVVVKQQGEWKINVWTIHNRFADGVGDTFEFTGAVPGDNGRRS
jgi:uncharacterized protein (TIGR02246 family)